MPEGKSCLCQLMSEGSSVTLGYPDGSEEGQAEELRCPSLVQPRESRKARAHFFLSLVVGNTRPFSHLITPCEGPARHKVVREKFPHERKLSCGMRWVNSTVL